MSFLFSMVVAALVSTPAPAPSLVFPTAPGTVWTYQADVQWTVPDSSEARSAELEWKASLLSSKSSGTTTVTVLSGFPGDLSAYEPGLKPGRTLWTTRGDGLYLKALSAEENLASAVAEALKGGPAGDRILTASPRVGDCLGDEPDRKDGKYCWSVERKITREGREGWAVAFQTLSDVERIEVVPGLGVTGYEYEHHGTVASVKATLKSWKRPESGSL